MNYIDFHCDTLSRLYYENTSEPSETLWKNNGHLDLTRLTHSGYLAQFFACFLHKASPSKMENHFEDALGMIQLMKSSLVQNDSARLALSYADYQENKSNGKLSCFLTVEEGGILDGDIKRLEQLYQKGIRLITLTWNFENALGFPHLMSDKPDTGLKPFGIEVVKRMEELGMDVASYDWYLDLRRYGGCKHAGFGVGFERLIMYLSGMQNIRDVLPFPRTPKNLVL